MNEKCKDCKWIESYKDHYICGYVAEVWHIEKKVQPDAECQIKKYEKRRGALE